MKSDFVIFDGSSVLVRAYFATVYPGRPIRAHEGVYTNAVMGFLNMMFSALSQFHPSHCYVAWDESRNTFRKTLYPEYKGTRGELPEPLLHQFDTMQTVLSAIGMCHGSHPDFEADDLMGTMAMKAREEGLGVVILTGDRDALQLVRDEVTVGIMKRGMTDISLYTPAALHAEYGVTPAQMIDLKGLMGDSSDNIPGIPGIGPKTAAKLIREYHSVENLLGHAENVPHTLRQRLTLHRETALLSKRLATIALDVPLLHSPDECRLQFNLAEGERQLRALRLERSLEQLRAFLPTE